MIEVHRPYPGVALVATEKGSVLLGAPADAFKATKAWCAARSVPFPRVLVAPGRRLVGATPQFAPEFFLYDFLFVYGAAMRPELERERLVLVLDPADVEQEKRALSITLNGPSREELAGYADALGRPLLDAPTVSLLAGVSEAMAIKKGDRPRLLDEMIDVVTFDRDGAVRLQDGALELVRTGPSSFAARMGGQGVEIDLAFEPPVVPFATLPVPSAPETPATFAIKPLGTRSGFDLSGPTTGFLLWVNGRAVVYDGPVGTRWLLERQGVDPSDVAAVVLSHCHEDHMGAFVELVMGGTRPRVYTAEPIYRSMLVKLGQHTRMKESEVASLVDYVRVTPGQPIDLFGATLDFFYTVHAIPTLGLSATLRHGGRTHRVQISGDTLGHEGLDRLRETGVLDPDTHARMRSLVPDRRDGDALYFADVGEALIHGHPRDWQGNPNRILYYHCPDDERTRGFGHEVAQAGVTHTLVEPPRLHPAVPGRLLHALSFLDLGDPRLLAELLHRGRTRHAAAGEVLVAAGEPAETLTVIVSGAADVLGAGGRVLSTLRPGELFGAIELVDAERRSRAEVRAATPVELFELDGALLVDHVAAAGLEPRLARISANRPHVDSARVFRTLDAPARSRIAALGIEEVYPRHAVIFAQGTAADDFFLLVDGRVAVEVGGEVVREIDAGAPDAFFGELAALHPHRRRGATVRALTPVASLRLDGAELRPLLEREMAVRTALLASLEERGG